MSFLYRFLDSSKTFSLEQMFIETLSFLDKRKPHCFYEMFIGLPSLITELVYKIPNFQVKGSHKLYG